MVVDSGGTTTAALAACDVHLRQGAGMLFHHDRARHYLSEDLSKDFRAHCTTLGIVPPVGRVGSCRKVDSTRSCQEHCLSRRRQVPCAWQGCRRIGQASDSRGALRRSAPLSHAR
jgi:hypothetical protein